MTAFENKDFSLKDEMPASSPPGKGTNNMVGKDESVTQVVLEMENAGSKQEKKGEHELIKISKGTTKKTTDNADNDSGDVDDDDDDDDDDDEYMNDTTRPNMLSRALLGFQNVILGVVIPHKQRITSVLLIGLLLIYLSYVGYAMYYRFGDEESIRLLVCTMIGLLLLAISVIKRKISYPLSFRLKPSHRQRVMCIIRWFFYIASAMFSVVFIIMDVAMKNPRNLISLSGLAFFVLVCCLFSQRPAKINWHTIYWCVILQFLLALFILRTSFGISSVRWITDRVNEFLRNAYKGSKFTFGAKYTDHKLIFGAIPTLLYINAFVAVLYYVGVIQWMVRVIGNFLTFVLHITPAEAMCVATNTLLNSATTGVAMKPYLIGMDRSELFTVFVAGQASVSGGFLGVVTSFGISIGYLIPASIMSAPATIAVSKLLLPSSKSPSAENVNNVKKHGMYKSLLDAAVTGAMSSLGIVASVAVNFYVFYGVLSFLNETLQWFGERVGVEYFSFDVLCSYIFFPLPAMMGVDIDNCRSVSRLLGYRLIGSTSLSFLELSKLAKNRETFLEYIATNGTWKYIQDDIYLENWNRTLSQGYISVKSEMVATYALCGLCGIVSLATAIAVFALILPKRRTFISKTAIPSLIGGNIACFMTACFAVLSPDQTNNVKIGKPGIIALQCLHDYMVTVGSR